MATLIPPVMNQKNNSNNYLGHWGRLEDESGSTNIREISCHSGTINSYPFVPLYAFEVTWQSRGLQLEIDIDIDFELKTITILGCKTDLIL